MGELAGADRLIAHIAFLLVHRCAAFIGSHGDDASVRLFNDGDLLRARGAVRRKRMGRLVMAACMFWLLG
jgi:hypothetical protein